MRRAVFPGLAFGVVIAVCGVAPASASDPVREPLAVAATDGCEAESTILTTADLTFASVQSGNSFVIGLTTEGEVYGWGQNSRGSVGSKANGTTQFAPRKIDFPDGARITEIHTSDWTTFARSDQGKWYSWGLSPFKAEGQGTVADYTVPTELAMPAGVTTFTELATWGHRGVIAIGDDGGVYDWGDTVDRIEPGTNPSKPNQSSGKDYTVPVRMDLPEGTGTVTDVAMGVASAYALTQDGRILAWGSNTSGQLGNGTISSQYDDIQAPSEVLMPEGVSRFTSVDATASRAMALGDDGVLYAWGYGWVSGTGSSDYDIHTPTPVVLPEGVPGFAEVVAMSGNVSAAVTEGGDLYAWGNSGFVASFVGQSSGSLVETPTQVVLPEGVTSVKEVGLYSQSSNLQDDYFLIGDDDRMYGLGQNYAGALGLWTKTRSSSLVEIPFVGAKDVLLDSEDPTAVSWTADVAGAITVTGWDVVLTGADGTVLDSTTTTTPAYSLTGLGVDDGYTLTISPVTAHGLTHTVTVRKATRTPAPTIVSHPTDTTADPGEPVEFATEILGVDSYHWQVSLDGETWKDVDEVTERTLRLTAGDEDATDGVRVRATAANCAGGVTTHEAVLTVRAVDPIDPGDVDPGTVGPGEPVAPTSPGAPSDPTPDPTPTLHGATGASGASLPTLPVTGASIGLAVALAALAVGAGAFLRRRASRGV